MTSDARRGLDHEVAAAFELDDAEVRVGSQVVWSGATLKVPPERFVAVLGPNGAGKTTLIRVLLGLQPLSKGRVTVLGSEAGQHRSSIAYLPQRRSFDPGTPARGVDIVRLGLDGHRFGLPLPAFGSRRAARLARRTRIDEVLELVGASDYAGRPIGELSGGEQQRILIAQALAPRPSLLLLDEPLDSLDLPNQAEISALVSTICRREGVTVVMVAHDVTPILPYLDAVVYMAGGAVACGSPESVITTETLSRLYASPVEVLRTTDGRLVIVGQPESVSRHGSGHAHP